MSDVCQRAQGQEGIGLELKYKATLKPEDAEGSKGRHQQEQLPQHAN